MSGHNPYEPHRVFTTTTVAPPADPPPADPPADPAPPDPHHMTENELRAELRERGMRPDGRWRRRTLESELVKARASTSAK